MVDIRRRISFLDASIIWSVTHLTIANMDLSAVNEILSTPNADDLAGPRQPTFDLDWHCMENVNNWLLFSTQMMLVEVVDVVI